MFPSSTAPKAPYPGSTIYSNSLKETYVVFAHICFAFLWDVKLFSNWSVCSSRPQLDFGGDGGEAVGSRQGTAEGIE